MEEPYYIEGYYKDGKIYRVYEKDTGERFVFPAHWYPLENDNLGPTEEGPFVVELVYKHKEDGNYIYDHGEHTPQFFARPLLEFLRIK